MPSGRTHDRITLWSLPFVTGFTFKQTHSGNLTLIVAGAFLFSGLMFGPDLDLYSVQYKRWGCLRYIWIPYQNLLHHRSLLSHGLIVGTTLRVMYLASWLGILGVFALGIAQLIWGVGWDWQLLVQAATASVSQNPAEWIALYLGLELGSMSHSICDWGSSAYKRCKKQSKTGLLLRGKMLKKHKVNRVTRQVKSVTSKSRQQR